MCLAIYIASDHPLPLIEWNEDEPQFNVVSHNENELVVKKQFRYPNVVYAGSHEGCGCGFSKEWKSEEELAMVQPNCDSLVIYLQNIKEQGANFEVFCCWEGDQDSLPEFKEKLSIASLAVKEFEFKEKAYYEIS